MGQQNFGTAMGKGFVLNEATLMLGPLGQGADLLEEKHSIGLFKNLAIANDKTFQPLTQGVTQSIVDQVKTGDNWTISGNGYEYNPRTIMYALGQAGYTADVTQERTRTVITTAAAVGESEITVADATGLKVGDWVILYSKIGDNDGLAYKIETLATNTVTLDRKLVVAVAENDELVLSTLINTNDPESCTGATYFSAKIVSATTGCDPIVMIAPKVQVTSGLNLSFGVADYSNMAFQVTVMDMIRSDAGYEDYRQHGKSKLWLVT